MSTTGICHESSRSQTVATVALQRLRFVKDWTGYGKWNEEELWIMGLTYFASLIQCIIYIFFMKTKFRLCCSFQFPWNLQWMKARLLCTNLMAVAYSRSISFDLSGDSFAGSRPLRLQLSPLRLQQMLLQLQLQFQLLPHRTETHLSPVTCCRLKWSLLLPKVQIEVITQTDCLYTQKNISININ